MARHLLTTTPCQKWMTKPKWSWCMLSLGGQEDEHDGHPRVSNADVEQLFIQPKFPSYNCYSCHWLLPRFSCTCHGWRIGGRHCIITDRDVSTSRGRHGASSWVSDICGPACTVPVGWGSQLAPTTAPRPQSRSTSACPFFEGRQWQRYTRLLDGLGVRYAAW